MDYIPGLASRGTVCLCLQTTFLRLSTCPSVFMQFPRIPSSGSMTASCLQTLQWLSESPSPGAAGSAQMKNPAHALTVPGGMRGTDIHD